MSVVFSFDVMQILLLTHGGILCFSYDQTLFEDDNKNRMMETKELFEWVLKQSCFKVFP